MTEAPEFDAGDWLDALAPVLGLTVAAEYRPGVIANLELAARMAALLERIALDDEAEPAPVFTA
jgi:hypothetical protein